MKTARIFSATLFGLRACEVRVEVDISPGLPKFIVVGLTDTAIQEARDRVRAAVKNSGFDFPLARVTVNLAPAHMRKEGSWYDLPIALGMLVAGGVIKADFSGRLLLGELSLDGEIRPVRGVLPVAMLAGRQRIRELYVPAANAEEAARIAGVAVLPCHTLRGVAAHFSGQGRITPHEPKERRVVSSGMEPRYDMSLIRGQEQAKRALQICAAGGHNVLLSGTPGSGKTLLARSFVSLLPPLTASEALEVTSLYSIAGRLSESQPYVVDRPFRHPHHTASTVSLVGGGGLPRPGEISLAHRGVLFLDEFPEYPRQVIEALRQPLEEGRVVVARQAYTVEFPARFILIAAQNPCPCGYFGDETRMCSCTPQRRTNYIKKVSGPIKDRIDLHLTLSAVKFDKMIQPIAANTTAALRQKVQMARKIQLKRFEGARLPLITNSEMGPRETEKFCGVRQDSVTLLRHAMSRMNLSNRAYHRILKVARTIADLEAQPAIESHHIAEALQYREREGK